MLTHTTLIEISRWYAVTIYVIGQAQQSLHATTIKHNTAINKKPRLNDYSWHFFSALFKARPLLLLVVLCSGWKTNFRTFS